jgi:hypothetical protein
MRRALDTDPATQLAIALRTVEMPDINVAPGSRSARTRS